MGQLSTLCRDKLTPINYEHWIMNALYANRMPHLQRLSVFRFVERLFTFTPVRRNPERRWWVRIYCRSLWVPVKGTILTDDNRGWIQGESKPPPVPQKVNSYGLTKIAAVDCDVCTNIDKHKHSQKRENIDLSYPAVITLVLRIFERRFLWKTTFIWIWNLWCTNCF